MKSDVLARLLRLISTDILGNGSNRRLGPDTPLLSFGLDLDSVAVLELLMAIETEFGVRFEGSDLSVELFKTIGTLAEAIERKMTPPSQEPDPTTLLTALKEP